jgi:hypothetical protein
MSVRAQQDDSKYPETLILEPGDQIEGRFDHLERGTTRDGEPRAIAVLEVDGVPRSLWLHETALRGKFAELRPRRGERVLISKGSEKVKSPVSGYSYWPFQVTCPERPPETLDWDDPLLDAPDDVEPEPDTPAGPIADRFGDDPPF